MTGEVFYRNGIEWPLTLELLAIFCSRDPPHTVVQAMPLRPERAKKGEQMLLLPLSGHPLVAPHMSAFRGKADIPFCAAHVCF